MSKPGDEPPDFTAIAIAYAEAALADRTRRWACRRLRSAARRFLTDLERAQGARPPFTFDWRWSQRACRFIETLPHVEEKWETDTLLLQPAQVFFVVQLFGFRGLDGARRYSEALYCVARKNAKSTIAAAILLACLCLENDPGAQILSAATTGDQARIIWAIAKRMVDATPALRASFNLGTYSKSIARYNTGSSFKSINAKASTQDGLNPSVTSLDEIHAHKTSDLLNVLRSAAGARGNPLWLFLTTEGYPNAGPWEDLRTFAEHVLDGVLRADHFLPLIYQLDDDDDELDATTWVKANPLIESNTRLKKQLGQLAENAKAMPSVMAEFVTKRCNRPASGAGGLVNLHKFTTRNGGTIADEELKKWPCWGSLDLASTTDMAALCTIFVLPDCIAVRMRYWVPADAVKQRSERRTVPYDSWVRQGFVIQTPGEVIDYSVIEAEIIAEYEMFGHKAFAYDPWNAAATANTLVEAGLPMQQFIQGPKSYHPAMQAFERAYLAGMLRHGGHPVLRWNAANLVARYDANMNSAPDRKRSKDKIDGVVTLIMSMGLAAADDSADFDKYLANVVSA